MSNKFYAVAAFCAGLLLSIFVLAPQAHAEHSITIGLWTDHLGEPKGDLNEKNDLVVYTNYGEYELCDCSSSRFFWQAGRFINSHYKQTQFVSAGKEYRWTDNASGGVMIAAIRGYEGYLDTHFEGVIFAPASYFKYDLIRVSSIAHVINVGIELEF